MLLNELNGTINSVLHYNLRLNIEMELQEVILLHQAMLYHLYIDTTPAVDL